MGQQITMKKRKNNFCSAGRLDGKVGANRQKIEVQRRQMLKKEIRYNKNENLDNCFNLARATEEKLQQMSDKVETTDKEREKNIKRTCWK